MSADPFGAKSVWQSHYDLAIETMHPVQAVKAANASALAYAEGNHYISMGGKSDATEYRMVPKEVGR